MLFFQNMSIEKYICKDEIKQKWIHAIPADRICDSQGIENAIMLLVLAPVSYNNGINNFIDGGRLSHLWIEWRLKEINSSFQDWPTLMIIMCEKK